MSLDDRPREGGEERMVHVRGGVLAVAALLLL